jgi:IclR family acetate operon transcriptional repressor
MSVKQAAQVLDILEFFAQRQQPATLADVVDHFGWPRSSTFNLLVTLSDRGYLYEPRPRGGYYPTPVWAEVVEKVMSGQPTPPGLQGVLEELAEVSGETVVLAAQTGSNVVYIDSVESPHAVRYAAAPGKVVPLLASASGRALLAQRTPVERAAILRKAAFKAYTPYTLMSAEAVEAEIQLSLQRGWFENRSEYSEGLGSLALPVSVQGRSYAILIAGPYERICPRFESLAKQARAIVESRLQIKLPEFKV